MDKKIDNPTDGSHGIVNKEKKIKQKTEDYFGKTIEKILEEDNPEELKRIRRLQKSASKKMKIFLNRKIKEHMKNNEN